MDIVSVTSEVITLHRYLAPQSSEIGNLVPEVHSHILHGIGVGGGLFPTTQSKFSAVKRPKEHRSASVHQPIGLTDIGFNNSGDGK